MDKLQDQIMILRVAFLREHGKLFIDDIPAYCDFIEKKLAKMILDKLQREEQTESMKCGWRSPDKK